MADAALKKEKSARASGEERPKSAALKGYLVLYNVASAAGWAYCLYLTLTAVSAGDSPATLWSKLRDPLTYVQTAAIMEVVHAATSVVPSPLPIVAAQVASRLLLVWAYTRPYTACQAHWSLFLMVASWSCAEIPRYLFYAFKQIGEAPYALFWLRYSGFMLLYPTGISGECIQMWSYFSGATNAEPMYWITLLIAVVYVVGSPGMVKNMYFNRAKEFKKLKDSKKSE